MTNYSLKVNLKSGFTEGTSENLPKVCFDMFLEFVIENKCYDRKLVKKLRRKKEKVCFEAEEIKNIQLKREDKICTVKGTIESKHPVGDVEVLLQIDEKMKEVISGCCSNCNKNFEDERSDQTLDEKSGCRHLARLLKWLNDRSEEELLKSVVSYWKTNRNKLDDNEDFELSPEVAQCSFYYVSLNCDLIDQNNLELFLSYIRNILTPKVCEEIERETRSQSKNPLWYELRYGRITASTLYQASRCKTPDGSLDEMLMTLKPLPYKETKPMRRGKDLEIFVLEALQKRIKKSIKPSGLILNRDYPVFGASPDGVGTDFVVEIKCPISESSINRYYKDGEIQNRYKSQIQLQMLLSKKNYGYFVIADPQFEVNKKLKVVKKEYFDSEFINSVLVRAENYWKNHIFPKLIVPD